MTPELINYLRLAAIMVLLYLAAIGLIVWMSPGGMW